MKAIVFALFAALTLSAGSVSAASTPSTAHERGLPPSSIDSTSPLLIGPHTEKGACFSHPLDDDEQDVRLLEGRGARWRTDGDYEEAGKQPDGKTVRCASRYHGNGTSKGVCLFPSSRWQSRRHLRRALAGVVRS